MSSPNPSTRTSSLFSDAQRVRHKEATLKRKHAQTSCDTLQSSDSAEYWRFRREEEEANLEIAEVEWEALRAGCGSARAGELHAEERDYQRKKAEVLERNEAAERRIDRYMARSALLSAQTTKNPVLMRRSFVELLLSMLTKTSRSDQSYFRRDLESVYGNKKEGRFRYVWCPSSGGWEYRSNVKAAHIFPTSLGQDLMTCIFGPDAAGELFTARNGLFLQPMIEEAFDKHLIVIVPTEEAREWKFLVLDRSGLWNAKIEKGRTFADLHNSKLVFQPGRDARPRARYFYFHYLLAMLRIGRKGEEEKAMLRNQIAEATGPTVGRLWASDEKYLRENMIRAFIEGMAHDWPDLDRADLLAHAEKDRESDFPEMVRSLVEAEVESDDEDDEEDE